ncbi:uncharacterized protein [Physcomitrium patens]|uniref:uncharacterized protein isoform X1 n=1 Tax=Physcomitrium patens TaxID=3218 RepID=UPI003CCCEEF1
MCLSKASHCCAFSGFSPRVFNSQPFSSIVVFNDFFARGSCSLSRSEPSRLRFLPGSGSADYVNFGGIAVRDRSSESGLGGFSYFALSYWVGGMSQWWCSLGLLGMHLL